MVEEERPYIVIGSPPCTSFCTINRRFYYRRMSPERVQRAIREGNVLLKFALEVYELQLSEGRHFLHEHPASATSWHVPRMMALRRRQGVGETVAHLCQDGLTTLGRSGERLPAQKPTRFLSSAPELLKLFGQQCTGDLEYQLLMAAEPQPPPSIRRLSAARCSEALQHSDAVRENHCASLCCARLMKTAMAHSPCRRMRPCVTNQSQRVESVGQMRSH